MPTLPCAGCCAFISFFFFNDTATTEIYTLSLHDALPIWALDRPQRQRIGARHWPRMRLVRPDRRPQVRQRRINDRHRVSRSEEHTSELQSLAYLVCRLLLEKKKKKTTWPRCI